MTGQYTPIISIDYNSIQSKVSQVLGVGSGNYGYGQNVSSSQIPPRSIISATHWNRLRTDLLKARQHQTGTDESANLPIAIRGQSLTNTDISKFSVFANLADEYRLNPPPSNQATRENLVVATRTTEWNNVIIHTVSVQFTSSEAARWYFNTGSTIEISSSRTGGSSTLKNANWTTLLASIGTITFDRVHTTSSGSGTGSAYGYYNLATIDTLIYRRFASNVAYSAYNDNQYAVYARVSSDKSAIIFTIKFIDDATHRVDENIDGTLVSTMQVYRASGDNVSVNRPAASSTMTGGEVVITPPPPVPDPSYQITRDLVSIGEGETEVVFTITTQNVPNGNKFYWSTSTSAGITSADFSDNTLSGSILIFNNTATVTRSAIKDTKTEGTENFYIELRSTSITGPILAISPTVDIVDLSTDPVPPGATYNITPSASILGEGDPDGIIFTIDTTGVPTGTTLFWSIASSSSIITSGDFSDNTLIGYFTIKNNKGTVNRIAAADLTTEGTETFYLELRTGSATGPIVAVSQTILILDLSIQPNFSLTATPLTVNEGGTVTVTLDTLFLPSNTKLYLTTVGSLTESDFTQTAGITVNSITKEFTFISSPVTWTYQIIADKQTEGPETLVWQIRTESKDGPIRASSPSVLVNDSSVTPTYALTSTPESVNEGSIVTTTLTMSGVDVGTVLYLVLSEDSWGSYDDIVYTSGPTIDSQRSFVVTGSSMIWTHTIATDQLTEGDERFSWKITYDSQFSTNLAIGNTVTIRDTSLSPLRYDVVAYPQTVQEGSILLGPTRLTIMDSPVDSLVAYWVMDETSGTILNDKVINSLQIAKGGSFSWSTINGNPAAVFNGTSSSYAIVQQDSTNLRLTAKAGSSYTIEAWIYPTGPGQDPTYGGEIINHDSDFEVARRPNGQIIVASDWGIGTDINLPGGGWIYPPTGVAVTPIGVATHIAVVIDNTTLKIYKNGVLEWTKTGLNRLTSNHPSNKTYIGNRPTKIQGFEGRINNLRVWNIARTDAQIQAWYTTVTYPGVQSTPTVITSIGNTVSFNITTVSVTDGTTLYWKINGVEPTLDAADFVDNTLTGTVQIFNNQGVINKTLSADLIVEGPEHFTLSLYSDAGFTNVLGTSQTVTVQDTSVSPEGSIEYTVPGPLSYAPFVVPSGVTKITVEVTGGGGSGGYSWKGAHQCGGGGGGSGGYMMKTFDVTPGQNIKVNVGAGGIPSYNEVEYTRNGRTTSLTIDGVTGTASYQGSVYKPVSHPAWKNPLMRSYAVWMIGLFQRNIMRWDLYIPTSGNYIIKAAGDDQLTMWIDGETIFSGISGFKNLNASSITRSLTAGIHTIIISGKDTAGTVAGVAATISKSTGEVIWHTRMGRDAIVSDGIIHVSGGIQGNDGMSVDGNDTAGLGGIRGMIAGQDGALGEKVASSENAHPGVSLIGTAYGGQGGASHYGEGGSGGKGKAGEDGKQYGAGGGGAGALKTSGSNSKVSLGGRGRDGYIKISWSPPG